ncbi:MAG: hypothetical protein WC889_07795 [Myxococcota bacterium]|jgi:hypothetical protein
MKPTTVIGIPTAPQRAKVLEFAGMDGAAVVPPQLDALLARLLASAGGLLSVVGRYAVCRASVSDGAVSIEGGPTFVGRALSGTLQGSFRICMMAVTVGDAVSRASRGAMDQGRFTEGLLLDAIGSAAVEAAADQIQKVAVRSVGDPSIIAGERVSPGYCDFRVEEQGGLLDALGAVAVGITVNGSSFMSPEKSVSAVFGMGRDGEGGFSRNRRPPCRTCSNRVCRYRVVKTGH